MFKCVNVKSIVDSSINTIPYNLYCDTKITIIIDDHYTLSFTCLNDNVNELIYGFLGNSTDVEIIFIKHDEISVKSNLPFDLLSNIMQRKDLIGTCESIELTRTKIDGNKLVIPFNDSRLFIAGTNLLILCRDFFSTRTSEYLNLFYSRAILLDTLDSNDIYDTSPKTNLYKIIGSCKCDLLKYIILINFDLSLELLEKLILAKATFVIANRINSFNVARIAQKFGLTIGCFIDDELIIVTHASRVV